MEFKSKSESENMLLFLLQNRREYCQPWRRKNAEVAMKGKALLMQQDGGELGTGKEGKSLAYWQIFKYQI